FFFQAEDGIRDFHVTGVQTCALPIYVTLPLVALFQIPLGHAVANHHQLEAHTNSHNSPPSIAAPSRSPLIPPKVRLAPVAKMTRSEERRVGKECRSGWTPCHGKQKRQ